MPDDEDSNDDVVDNFENSPDGDLKQSTAEENLDDDSFDQQQGFNYPESSYKDSITKFYRHIISMMFPKKVVRVANFSFKEKRNAKIYLNMADYNLFEGNDIVARFFNQRAVVESAVSMGYKGFIVTSIMTQRRIVQRQTDKSQNVSGWSKPKQQAPGGGV